MSQRADLGQVPLTGMGLPLPKLFANHVAYAKCLSSGGLEFWCKRGRGCPRDQTWRKTLSPESLRSFPVDNIFTPGVTFQSGRS